VIALYALNGVMVLTDILLTLRNRAYHVRRSGLDAMTPLAQGTDK
jgi:hypothetical protein